MKLTYLKQHPIRAFFIIAFGLFFLNVSYNIAYNIFFGKEYKYEPNCHWQEGCSTHVFGNGAFQISPKRSRGYSLKKISPTKYHDGSEGFFHDSIALSLSHYLEFDNFGYIRGLADFKEEEKIEAYLLLDLKAESYTTYKALAEIPKEHQENFKKMIALE